MLNWQIYFIDDDDMSVCAFEVREQVQGEDDRAIAAVLEWNDTVIDLALLYSSEDILDCCPWFKLCITALFLRYLQCSLLR